MTKNTLAKNAASFPFPGLTGNQIKFIAAVMMLADHIHQMFIMHGAPGWLTWIGRPVAPIFLFMCAEGFHYTRSRKRYMLLLLIGYEFMGLTNAFLSRALPNEDVLLINNIFGTLFLSTVYMLAADMLRAGVREKKTGKILRAAALALLPVVSSIPTLAVVTSPELAASVPAWLLTVFVSLIPNLLFTEGGFALVLMGLLFYVFRNNRLTQAAILLLMSAGSLLTSGGAQWLMGFAAIPLLMYNGKRGGGGKGSKYFFYVFYPAHIYLLYIAERVLARAI